ncbi:hypothetical protein NYO67_4563 [Aspergillus flavus]|nr:hypothetical protein NYO67_4563 [Aspergillus flavus]
MRYSAPIYITARSLADQPSYINGQTRASGSLCGSAARQLYNRVYRLNQRLITLLRPQMPEPAVPWQFVPSSSAAKRQANRAAAQRCRDKRKIEADKEQRIQELSQERVELLTKIDRLEQEKAYLHARCLHYRYQRDYYISAWRERFEPSVPLPEVPRPALEIPGIRNDMVIQRYEQESDFR